MSEEAGFTPEEDEIEESSPSEDTEAEETETQDADSEQESEEQSDDAEPVEKPNRLNKRFAELTAQRKAAEQKAALLEQQNREILERLSSREQPKQEQPPPQRVPKPGLPPDRYDFGNDKEYQEAFNNYQAHTEAYTRQVFHDEMRSRQQQEQQQNLQHQQREAQRQIGEKLKNVAEVGGTKYADFADVAFIPTEVAGFTSQLDHAADIAYFWGQKPEERARITQLARTNPLMAAAEITRLDERFAAKKVTNAPPPPKKVGSNNKGNVDPDKLPIEEWIKLREAGKIK